MGNYHSYKKSSSYLRDALYKAYNQKCAYCGSLISQPRYMHVDHILPTNKPSITDEEINIYLSELDSNGFILDSIENYLPTCSSCNRDKSNHIYVVANLRYFHEKARQHVDEILQLIEKAKTKEEYYYEPIDDKIWKQLDFKYQRDISHAIMGYRLTAADVKACPVFPQVNQTKKQLSIVDYAFILGETGCGKSISLFQVGFDFFKNGWQIYLLNGSNDLQLINLPDNSEKSMYLIDDAQIYSDHFINNLCEQARPNRKILFAKTTSNLISTEDIVLTNTDAVNTLYQDFVKRKNEIWPIVKKCDNHVGINMFDTPIEYRLNGAKEATTPWQFTYILRGGWNTMKELYSSIVGHNNCDLLVATIAAFQILNLDRSVNLDYINSLFSSNYPQYSWELNDISYLIGRRIVISEDDIRIVHMQSANVVVALFFDDVIKNKQAALLEAIENEFIAQHISPLGMVWLCNGCRNSLKNRYNLEKLFISDKVKSSVNEQIKSLISSEDIRNMMYLLEKIISTSDNPDLDLKLIKNNQKQLISLANKTDSVSAWGFKELLNTLYNQDKSLFNSFSLSINWNDLMLRMESETAPNMYSWGQMFNRGIFLLGKKKYTDYSNQMFALMKHLIMSANINNIDQLSFFLSAVAFLNYDSIHSLMPMLSDVYKMYFEKNMKEAIYIFDYEFLGYLCGVGSFLRHAPSAGQKQTANMIIRAISNDNLAKLISESGMREWNSISNILILIYTYSKQKYTDVFHKVDLNELSLRVYNIWDNKYDICLVLRHLYAADEITAKKFMNMNISRIQCFYSVMIAIDATTAIKANLEQNTPLELFIDNWWEESLLALKALYKSDKDFTVKFLDANIQCIVDKYNNVTALDFEKKDSLDLLKLINVINGDAYKATISSIDKEKVLRNWDNCGGIDPRKKRIIKLRKDSFLQLIEN